MVKSLPKITKEFMENISLQAQNGTYRTTLEGIPIDVFPYVFPPQSPFSESTHTVYDEFKDLENKKVLDIGTGTGIQAIKAALAGANYVQATDILPEAVACAKHNVFLNGLENKIKVYKSNIFSKVNGQFDLIIANLPILDYKENNIKFHSLSDPNFRYHEALFNDARDYMKPGARIVMCHANLQEEAFEKLENLASRKGFNYKITRETNSLGYDWKNYEFFLGEKQ